MTQILKQQPCAPEPTVSDSPRTTSDVAREVGKSTTTTKHIAREIHAPILKTASGIWIWNAKSVEKLKQEIARREIEDNRK